MKVGLVPLLYDEYNYGGVLQFYALQSVLKKNNIDSDIIFFANDEKVCGTEGKNKLLLKIKILIAKTLNAGDTNKLEHILYNRKIKINEFKKHYYTKTVDADKIDFSDYDAVICGSDQIWNPLYARKRAFLEYVPDTTNKVIYGASIGRETMSEDEKIKFKPRIERLDHVSVREYSAKKILDSFIMNKKIQVVLDPTILLFPREWENILKPCSEQNYILTYFLGEYADRVDYIRRFSEKKDLKIINIPCASGEKLDKNRFGDIEMADADPGEFIGLIHGAEYVFTDSFHACVFSVLFKKQFWVFKRDGSSSMYGRIDTLLHNFELPDRSINVQTNIDNNERLDYAHNEEIQIQLRKKSIDYLIGSIKNGQN